MNYPPLINWVLDGVMEWPADQILLGALLFAIAALLGALLHWLNSHARCGGANIGTDQLRNRGDAKHRKAA